MFPSTPGKKTTIQQCQWCGRVYAPPELESDEGFTERHREVVERESGHPLTGEEYPAKLPPHGNIYYPRQHDELVTQGMCPRCVENARRASEERRRQRQQEESEGE